VFRYALYWFKFAGPYALSEVCGDCHQRVEALEVARVHDPLSEGTSEYLHHQGGHQEVEEADSKEVSKAAKKRRVEPPVSEVVDDDGCAQVAS
jgi:hypothetical protein